MLRPTSISLEGCASPGSVRGVRPSCVTLLLLGLCIFFSSLQAEENGPDRAEREFRVWLDRFLTDSQDVEVAWKFARACFDWAEVLASQAQREKVAEQGIDASRRAIALAPWSASGHYYLALNLGQLARTRTLSALRLVKEMERSLSRARELDAMFDYGGPDRSLGLLYRDAPGWPASIGNRRKALRHLERAVELSPDFPENRLYLLETHLKYNDMAAAKREFIALQSVLPRAREKWQGEEWAEHWVDWDKRWEEIRKRF